MTDEPDFIIALKVVSGITCLLSILGAGLIVATYVAFRDLRTVARQQLVNLSLADMTVAASHFVGLATLQVENYETPHNSGGNGDNAFNCSTSEQNTLCKVQGGFTMLGTLASFLWTLALGFYMLMLQRTDVERYLLFLYYPIWWGVPLTLTLWFGLVKPTYLGFGEGADIGL
jgi:G protein-coupled receptor 157